MFAIPGILLIITAIYVRPQEISATLGPLPILHGLFVLAVFGFLLDLKTNTSRLIATPLTAYVIAFAGWVGVTVIVRAQSSAPLHLLELSICVVLALLIAHGVQSFRALGAVAAVIVGVVVLVSAVAVQQRFAPTGCIQIDESNPGDTASGQYDGRPCTTKIECYGAEAEPGAEYMCEHVGLLGTTSIGRGRVRYRGVLQDPNELSLAGAIGLPLAFALASRRRKAFAKRALVPAMFALIAACIVLSRSRSGQLVFLIVLAIPFLHRLGKRGFLLAGLLALPLLLLGGRSGLEAQSSTLERADAWAEAISIWRVSPVFGVGLSEFGRYHYLTAHNSILLVLAELGLPGMLLFSVMIYVAVKIPLTAWRATFAAESTLSRPEAKELVRSWSLGMLAALAGLLVGMSFLSFAYHYVLWIYLGLAGALYSAIRRHDPSFSIRIGARDLFLVALLDFGMLAVVYGYTRYALG